MVQVGGHMVEYHTTAARGRFLLLLLLMCCVSLLVVPLLFCSAPCASHAPKSHKSDCMLNRWLRPRWQDCCGGSNGKQTPKMTAAVAWQRHRLGQKQVPCTTCTRAIPDGSMISYRKVVIHLSFCHHCRPLNMMAWESTESPLEGEAAQ